ncbi:PIN domain-containing protein [uncultured Psychrobacter sp.]|uniref:PIN domain-containing protein n=1 Tax=uncultured Psychrobacter sp. TaxID=259303 RepID=UPI002606088B|nr:PIN domain-containing protein [uncultured Psychrobacter sp.]
MMVMADTNFLVKLVDDKETYRLFMQYLERDEISLGLCTPVIAEFLVKDDNFDRATFLSKVNSFVQIFDFDMKSAVLSAKIFRDLLDTDYIKQNNIQRQVIKVDIQIISTTIANGISKLYTADEGIVKIIDHLKLPIEIVNFENNELMGLSLFQGDDR